MDLFNLSGISTIMYAFAVVFIGFLVGRYTQKIEEHSLAIVCLMVFVPAFLFRQTLAQNLTANVFTMVLFFLVFHTGFLVLISRGIFAIFHIPKSIGKMYLINILIVNLLGLRHLQPQLGPPDQSVEVINVFIFFHLVILSTLGIFLASQKERLSESFLHILKTPLIYVLFLGLLFAGMNYTPRFEVLESVDKLLNALFPVALLIIGIVWGKHIYLVQIQEYLVFLPGLILCLIISMIISPLAAIAITYLMGLDNITIQRAFILSSGMPTGILAAVLVSYHRKSNERCFTVLCIFFTTLLSFILLPLLQTYVNWMYPLVQ